MVGAMDGSRHGGRALGGTGAIGVDAVEQRVADGEMRPARDPTGRATERYKGRNGAAHGEDARPCTAADRDDGDTGADPDRAAGGAARDAARRTGNSTRAASGAYV